MGAWRVEILYTFFMNLHFCVSFVVAMVTAKNMEVYTAHTRSITEHFSDFTQARTVHVFTSILLYMYFQYICYS